MKTQHESQQKTQFSLLLLFLTSDAFYIMLYQALPQALISSES